MFDSSLIESANLQKTKGAWLTATLSIVVHSLFIAGLLLAGIYMNENPDVLEKPIEAFLVSPAPPPPPPPPGPSTGARTTPKPVEQQKPREQFVAPTDTAQKLPEVEIDEGSGDKGVEGGVVGGVEGGVAGGVIGGVVGGVLGGTLGGQGTALRVGGDVKPPEVIQRIDPNYTEEARRARVQGVVILEAIIDAQGNVTDVRVIKPLPEGLGEEAAKAVRQWKFRPGTQHGRPVPVIFSLTVNFRLQ